MLNILWSFMILFSLIVAMFTGKVEETVNGAMTGATDAVNMCIGLLGVMCMWNGIMKIAEKSGLTSALSSAVRPLFGILFRNVDSKSVAGEFIIMNITANLLGMGNAATPSGLKAMQALKKENKTKEMALFTVLNTASFQLIPSTLIAMRQSAGSANPAEIIVPVWCASACSVIVAVMCAKAICK